MSEFAFSVGRHYYGQWSVIIHLRYSMLFSWYTVPNSGDTMYIVLTSS